MKRNHPIRRALAAALAAGLLCAAALPAGAAQSASLPKEEIVYGNLSTDGTVNSIYVVNHFDAQAGQTITDFGEYDSVRNMTTTDPVEYADGVVTITPAADGKVYYEGSLTDTSTLPWNIELHYFLDGTELSAQELGGKSGALEIRLTVQRNPNCTGDFFDQYALQTTITLDTNLAQNIVAEGATAANVGSDKQLMFILLPGQDSYVSVTADVTDFEMAAVSLNGVRLNLNLQVDGENLTSMMDELQSGAAQLDDGAQALRDGIQQVQAGLDQLNRQSSALTGGSARVRSALLQLQSALNGVSASADELETLLNASAQIQDGIAQLDDGAAQLESQLSFEAYKAILAENGLDLDQVQQGNAQAIEQLQGFAKYLPGCLRAQLNQIILLLQGNSANIDATQTYLDALNGGAQALHQGTSTLRESYAIFDDGVRQLGSALTGMLQNLALLTDAVNTLASQYGTLDNGVQAYTGGVGQLVAGCRQLTAGSAALAAGTGELADRTSGLDLGEQLNGLLDSLSGGRETASFVSAENAEVSSVQFVLKTQAIEKPAAAPEPEPEPVRLTFWQKLLKLFGLYRES